MSADEVVGSFRDVSEALVAAVRDVAQGHWRLALEEITSAAWAIKMRVRNELAQLAAGGQEMEDCYFCSVRMPTSLMTPHATNDGNEHLLCAECVRFKHMVLLTTCRDVGIR